MTAGGSGIKLLATFFSALQAIFIPFVIFGCVDCLFAAAISAISAISGLLLPGCQRVGICLPLTYFVFCGNSSSIVCFFILHKYS